ncbi:MAG TPA: EamA family transporter [Bryobacteraceae bacterium]|jgi:drug/metabolite transporter (DMT)-like permease|nr:EamA family transporter [Bryobacteraceae bacterium]
MKTWFLLAAMVFSTVLGDLLQSVEMKRHGEIKEFDPRRLGRVLAALARKKFLILAVALMAVSFFAFMTLLETADLSFAVPASAATLVFETILAKVVLKEEVDSRRWAGACLVAFGVVLLAR